MKRDFEKALSELINRAKEESIVIIIEGARQVGKTYAVNNFLKNWSKVISFNLEKDLVFKMQIDATTTFSDFSNLLRIKHGLVDEPDQILFIDEAQESERLGGYVRFMKEEWKHIKVILTGSSMSKLFKKEERVPVGRVKYLVVRPFSFREFLRLLEHEKKLDQMEEMIADHTTYNSTSVTVQTLHRELLSLFDSYLLVGGMPAAVKAYLADGTDGAMEIFAELVASQREDFYRREKVKTYLFIDALKGVANHVGTPSKYTHIAGNNYDSKIITQILKDWHIIIEIEQSNASGATNFAPKRYLYDIGILRFIRETSIPNISAIHTIDEKLRIPLGGILENQVVNSLLGSRGGYIPLSGWKRSSKADIEVDFIVKNINSCMPFEVKATLKPNERHFKNMIHYHQYNKTVRGEMTLISLAPYMLFPELTKECGIKAVNRPAYLM